MRDTETTRRPASASLVAAVLALAASAAACGSSPREVGKPPEGEVRREETLEQRAARERKERLQASGGYAAGDPRADPSRIGVQATHKFHRAGCPDLAGTAPADQTKFPSCWEAINNDYAPCARCSAGPDPDDGR